MWRQTCLLGLALTSLLGDSLPAKAQETTSEKKEAKAIAAEDQPRKVSRKLKVFKLEHCKPSELAQIITSRHGVYGGSPRHDVYGGSFATTVQPAPPAGSDGSTSPTDSERFTPTPPVNTAHDDEKRLLFVRGTEDQSKRIEKLVKAFDMPAAKLEKQKWDDMHLIPIRGAEAGNVQSILSQLGLATHTIQLGDASVIVLQESDDEEVEQILEVISELDSAESERATTKKTTTEKTTTENDRERR